MREATKFALVLLLVIALLFNIVGGCFSVFSEDPSHPAYPPREKLSAGHETAINEDLPDLSRFGSLEDELLDLLVTRPSDVANPYIINYCLEFKDIELLDLLGKQVAKDASYKPCIPYMSLDQITSYSSCLMGRRNAGKRLFMACAEAAHYTDAGKKDCIQRLDSCVNATRTLMDDEDFY